MKKNRGYITLFLLLSQLLCFGQKYTGTVLNNKTNTPVDGVYLCLLSADSLLISYAFSGIKGEFEINYEEEEHTPCYLHVQCMGYKKEIIRLSPKERTFSIRLEEEAFLLKDVSVSAKRIVARRDTLVYSVAGFSQPQDRSIADVIAKMPGMEVSANGQISYNGKSINRFYIEGMDLMSNRYGLASNNISKNRVKSVEVLQNHQPIEMLRGKNFSEQAAINLVLEDNSKVNLVGSADVGFGANEDDLLYNNRLLAMLFGGKYQTLSIYKNDNTGYDLFKEINPVTLAEMSREDAMEEGLITAVSTQQPDLDRLRYTFNKSHLVATNHLIQLAKKATLRTQISYFSDDSKRSNEIETEYLFGEELNRIVYESNVLHERRNRLDAALNLEINRANIYIKNDLKGTFDWFSANGNTVWNDDQRHLSSSPDRKYFSDVLDVKLPMSNERYISVTSSNSYNRHPQHLSLYSGEIQRMDYSSFHTHTSASFRHSFFKLYATYEGGFQGMFQSLESSIEKQQTIAKQRFEQFMPYAGLGLNYQNSSILASATVKLYWLDWHLKKAEESEKDATCYPDVNLYLRYTLTGTSSISMNYRYSEQLEDLRKVYDGDLFTSYRTIVNNAHRPEFDRSNRLSLRYQYSQPIKGLFFSLSTAASITQKHSAYTSSLLTDESLLVRRKQAIDYNAEMLLLNGRFSKSFAWWKSLVTVTGNYMKTKEAQFSNAILQHYNMYNHLAGLALSARPLPFLSFEMESMWQQSRIKSSVTDYKTDRLKHKLNFTFPITNGLMLGLDNSLYQLINTHKNSWFTDFRISYTYKRLELQLNANNILGKSTYEREFISSIERNYYRYTLRPREMIAKASFTF